MTLLFLSPVPCQELQVILSGLLKENDFCIAD